MYFVYWLAGYVAAAEIKEAPTKEQWLKILAEMNRQKWEHEYKPRPVAAGPAPYQPLAGVGQLQGPVFPFIAT